MSKMTRCTALVGAALLAGGLTACGPHRAAPAPTGPTHPGHSHNSATPSSSTPTNTPVAGTTPAQQVSYEQLQHAFDGATDVSASSYPGTVTDVGFTTYTKDLGCGFSEGTVTCQLHAEPSYAAPIDCHGAGTPGIALTDGKDPHFKCMGDVESGGGVIKDNLVVTVADLKCVVMNAEVTCIDGDEHGFRFGPDDYALTGSSGAQEAATPPAPAPTSHDNGDEHSGAELAGRYFTGEGTYGDDTSRGYDYGVWFLTDGWAYWGRPRTGAPTCTKVTGKPTSDDLAKGWGCVHYSYDASSGTVTVGDLKGTRHGDSFGFGDASLSEVALPEPGAHLAATVSNSGYSNCDDLFSADCHTWTTYFTMTDGGSFTLTGSSLTTWDGVDSGSVYGEKPDRHGTYRILSGGRIKLSYASGKSEIRTFAEKIDDAGRPDPSGPDGGVVLGTTDFHPDDTAD